MNIANRTRNRYIARMRTWIVTIMLAAFTLVTTFSSYSHAMPIQPVAKSAVSEHADCHGHGKSKEQTQNEKDGSGQSCCKKGMCKCANGSCHAGLKLLNNGVAALFVPLSDITVLHISEQRLASASPEGIKRPPRV